MDPEIVSVASGEWQKDIHMMYSDRLEEHRDQKLTSCAVAIAKEFSRAQGSMDVDEIKQTIRFVVPSHDPSGVLKSFQDLGYI